MIVPVAVILPLIAWHLFGGGLDESFTKQAFTWVVMVSQIVALALSMLLIARRLRRHGKAWTDVGFRRFKFWRAVRYMLGFYGIMALFLIGVAVTASLLLGPDAGPDQRTLNTVRQTSPLVALFLSVLLVPVLEEIVYRGVLFSALRARYRVGLSVLFSGLIFAVAHFDPFIIIAILPLGFYAAFMTYKLGSIYPAIMLHMSWNLLVFLVR